MAIQTALKYVVYEGNIFSDGGKPICPGCKRVVIMCSWHSVMSTKLKEGCCSKCGARILGVFTQKEWEKRRGWGRDSGYLTPSLLPYD